MEKAPFIQDLRAFTYTILSGVSNDIPVGHFFVQETRTAASRGGLQESTPEYGFRITDDDGNVVANIAPGMWPFVKKVIQEGAAYHSPACEEDNATVIGDVSFVNGA